MAKNIIEANVCRTVDGESTLWDKMENTSVQVLIGPNLNGLTGLQNNRGTGMLMPVEDANGQLILGIQVQSDPDWSEIGVIKNSAIANHVYWQQQVDGNGNPVLCDGGVIADPLFGDTNVWAKGLGWIVNSNVALADGTQASATDLTADGSQTVNAVTYKVTTVVNFVSGGSVQAMVGNILGTPITAAGVYVEEITAVVGGGLSRLKASDTFIGEIGFFSVLEVV